MLQFQRKKDTNILNSFTQKDTTNSFLSSDQSKTMYDYKSMTAKLIILILKYKI